MTVLSIALLLTALTAAETPSKPIYGVATVTDGDTLRMGDFRIRLFGIDAPEHDQTCSRSGATWQCGAEAADKLASLLRGKDVRCVPTRKDDFGRTLARCDLIGIDINEAMVASGYAVAFRKYSSDYAPAEERAKLRRLGIWAGTFTPPSEYRAKQRARSSPGRSQAKPTASSVRRKGITERLRDKG